MGFADLSIAELAQDYQLPVEDIFYLCDGLGIKYQSPRTRLPLEDAKAIILEVLAQRSASATQETPLPES